ncbi:hypothetical protein Kpol_316p3 [Vanderwaltozyma polyspora DSM 70294]|uniref:Uncharacterized protein n=1 Tax=Vanderwaltozyma polyspora (strain ATCC 22028 / DSM 70294 / BCRC 21397 / CBS 2163 / NBRC 10782 / NRRL Y-8283 / UCD 57-17) TaxID=436907 RepID=A7TSP3_VANPO|nr:uncharacterized protein Kpol_316p3 [Vanderwaltozyma polyspora DSM 70294]EDO14710.1 hypothetical protein Kpol_316p3 [Vanderwaltozyma polyspora DSM 70294]
MTLSIARIKISDNIILPLRVFINRKQLLYNITNEPIIQAPLLSNNSIVCLKSPNTRIFVSNNDLESLCDEIRDDILLIIYELTSQEVMNQTIGKLRVGYNLDFKKSVINRFFKDDDTGDYYIDSNILMVTRVSKLKYKFRFKKNWEVDIFINNIKKLSDLRDYLLFRHNPNQMSSPSIPINSVKKVLIMEPDDYLNIETGKDQTMILQEDENDSGIIDQQSSQDDDSKPIIHYRYKPTLNLAELIDIHVLQRPRRHKI